MNCQMKEMIELSALMRMIAFIMLSFLFFKVFFAH